MRALTDDSVLQVLWAKTGQGGRWHPLIYHMVDVAQVALALWSAALPPAARDRLSLALDLSEEDAGRWVAFLAGLHDIGKASPAFALAKSEALASLVARQIPRPPRLDECPHGLVTAWAVPSILEGFGLPSDLAGQLAVVLGGHHGDLPGGGEIDEVSLPARGGSRWETARMSLARRLAESVGLPEAVPTQSLDNATALFLAGLVSVADWVGSAAEHFEPVATDTNKECPIDIAAYTHDAERRAGLALERLGWLARPVHSARVGFRELFPRIAAPRPLQLAAVELAGQLDSPTLVLIEAPMGEGKTEAAMYLVDSWAATLGQSGCYFALPTQATSDQMLGRVREFLAGRYSSEVANLQLLHGHASLSAEFAILRRAGDSLFAPSQIYGGNGAREDRVVAAEWFTYRKRGLLAPFGVGTVDQALLAALQTRHVFVRLFGLAHKPIVVDEVHAYDTYMTSLLERLLEWLAALGSSVVLLSATLPRGKAEALLAAYGRGLGAGAVRPSEVAEYPRLSWLSARASGSRHVATSAEMSRTLQVRWVDGRLPNPGEPFALGEDVKEALRDGGCAAVICNTVRRAQDVYLALKPYFGDLADDGFPELDLLHARFPYEERQRRERRSLVRFGKPDGQVQAGEDEPASVCRPKRAVLVSTQIIEQSLDLDFDLMVSDLAPVDLLLQRSGRLQRHQRVRPEGLPTPTMWICLPELDPSDIPSFGQGDGLIYEPHVLLRSWLTLRGCDQIRIPEGVEELVESVYDDRECPADLNADVGDRWVTTRKELLEQLESDRREAEDRWLKRPDYDGDLYRIAANPLAEDAPDFHRAHQALTRLTEPTVEVVCLHGSTERPSLDPAGREPLDLKTVPTVPLAKRLLMRSLSIGSKRVVFALLGQAVPTGWQKSPLLRRHRLLAFGQGGLAQVGKYWLRLDDEVGLVVTDKTGR